LESYRHRLTDRLDLLPANLKMAKAEKALAEAKRQEYLLEETLAPARAAYDVILIDCPPSLSLLTTNALTTAQEVLIPLAPEYLGVQGLALLLEQIREVRLTKLNPSLSIVGVLLTMTDYRTNHNREMAGHVLRFVAEQHLLPGPVPMLGEIKRSIKVSEATEAGLPVTRFAPESEVALAYQGLSERLLATWQTNGRVGSGQ
jgi:chromosome partitioning protein